MSSKFYALSSGYQFPMTSSSTWETKDLNSLLSGAGLNYTSIPSDTTFYVIEFESNSTGAIYGCQNGDDTENWLSSSGTPAGNIGRASFTKFIPANAAHTLKLYLSSTTNGKWWLRGFGNSATWITAADKSSSVTGTGTYTIDCSGDVPAGAANGYVLCELSERMKIGYPSKTGGQYKVGASTYSRTHVIVPLDASRQFEVSGTVALTAGKLLVKAWFPPEALASNTDGSTYRYTPTNLSVNEQLPYTSSTVLDFWQVSNATTTTASPSAVISELTPRGASGYYTTTTDSNSDLGYKFVRPNSSGLVDTYNTVTGVYSTWRAGFVADSAAAEIVSINTTVAGATATVTFNRSVTSVTRLRFKSVFDNHFIDVTSFSGSGTAWTFTVPSPTNLTDGIRLGDIVVTPTTNTGAGADFTGLVYSFTNYTGINMEDVLSGNVCDGDTPALLTADQIAYDSTTGGSVDVHGIYSDTPPVYVGIQTMWHYAADYKWYSFTLTTTEPAASSGGLTSSGLTSVGLTNAGLTTAGL